MITHIILFFHCLIAAPILSHQLQDHPFNRAFEISKLNRHRSGKNGMTFIDKARLAAIRYHDATKDGSAVIKEIMDSNHKNKKTHIKELIKNPSVDLSAYDNYLAKKMLHDNNVDSLMRLVNNTRVDLSFDDNYLLKEAQKRQYYQMADILQYDSNIQNKMESRQEDAVIKGALQDIQRFSTQNLRQMNQKISKSLVEPYKRDDNQDIFSKEAATISRSVYPEEQSSVDINDLSWLNDELGWIEINLPLEDDWITLGTPDNVSLLSK